MMAVGRMFVASTEERRTPELVIEAVADSHGVTVADLVGPRRDQQIARARHHAMHQLHSELGLSSPVIGRLLGNRDHTTVLYGLRAFERGAPGRPLTTPAMVERLRCVDLVLSAQVPKELRPHLKALAERMRG